VQSIAVELQTRNTFHEQLGDRIGMSTRDDVQDLLFAGDLRHRDRNAGIDVADDEADLIAFNQLAGFLHAGADVVGGVFDQKLDRPAENAAVFVDFFGGEFGSHHLALCNRSIGAGDRIDHADPDRRFAAGFDDEGGRELHCSNGSA